MNTVPLDQKEGVSLFDCVLPRGNCSLQLEHSR